MRLLIDTHIFLWAMSGDTKLTTQARIVMTRAEVVFVSAVSIWEIAIKASLGKLDADVHKLADQLTHAGFRELPITLSHATAVYDLPHHHGDPFDRMLAAQAMTEPLYLLTADENIWKYTNLAIKA
jgi:PIN domain nuclease of toxin-antitoxin system